MTIMTFEEYVPNEGDGWGYVVDTLARDLEEVVAASIEEAADVSALLIGPHMEWSGLLGQRTAEMHLALVSDPGDPAFSPEPFTPIERQEMMHAARITAKRSLAAARSYAAKSEVVKEVLEHRDEVLARLQTFSNFTTTAMRIRCHGDYHLGQALWTGKDFVITDFDGEPLRSLAQRRRKRPALFDVAGMLRSFHYASRAAALRVSRALAPLPGERLEPWLALWYRGVADTFLQAYFDGIPSGSPIIGDSRPASDRLLDFFLLEKALYELGYEANNRPDWIEIPAAGIRELVSKA